MSAAKSCPRVVVESCDGWPIDEQLILANAKDGRGNAIYRRMSGTCLEAACQDRKDNNREKQDRRNRKQEGS